MSYKPKVLALADGGTNANLTASNGGILYSTASAGAILAGTSTANQIVLSGSSTTPAWSTATYPATSTANQLLYSSATNTIAGLSTANGGVLTTSASGVPSIDTTNFSVLSTGVQVKANNTNTAPPAGFLGQQIVATAQNVAAGNNGNAKTITSIVLTPGVWDITALAQSTSGSVNLSLIEVGISTTTNSFEGNGGDQLTIFATAATNSFMSACVPAFRVLVSTNTTYYCVVRTDYASGSPTVNARISGVRVG